MSHLAYEVVVFDQDGVTEYFPASAITMRDHGECGTPNPDKFLLAAEKPR